MGANVIENMPCASYKKAEEINLADIGLTEAGLLIIDPVSLYNHVNSLNDKTKSNEGSVGHLEGFDLPHSKAFILYSEEIVKDSKKVKDSNGDPRTEEREYTKRNEYIVRKLDVSKEDFEKAKETGVLEKLRVGMTDYLKIGDRRISCGKDMHGVLASLGFPQDGVYELITKQRVIPEELCGERKLPKSYEGYPY